MMQVELYPKKENWSELTKRPTQDLSAIEDLVKF